MSQHPSLKLSGKIRKKRNVLKRFERIDILSKDGRWKEGDKALGLPKNEDSTEDKLEAKAEIAEKQATD